MNIKIPEETISETTCKILWPPVRKNMEVLDKAVFTKVVKIPTIFVNDRIINKEIKNLKPYLLKIIGMKPVQPIEWEETEDNEDGIGNSPSMAKKKVFLNPEIIKVTEENNLSKFLVDEIQLNPEIAQSAHFESLELSYDNWSWSQLFDVILPDDQEKVSGFSHIGHIIHLNLREHHFRFKTVIAQILLDKIHHAKTVVNKLNSISNKYRNFEMEILAGEPRTIVNVKQSLCNFEFDFANVYWNSRLSTEHERIFKVLQIGDVLYDVFAGVGPFSIPVAKKCFVLANDLNPESYRWLQNNVKKNKVDSKIKCFNKDGRVFIQQDVAADLKQKIDTNFDFSQQKLHVTMNLPAMAVDFLDSFWNLLKFEKPMVVPSDLTLIVHVYCFIKDIDQTDVEVFKEKALSLVEEKIDFTLPKQNIIGIFIVRNVAPFKEMLRVSFKMPHEILLSHKTSSLSLKRKLSEI